ncbi:MAG: hypothetical protein WD993_10845 [Thermoleophilaceae bacterium]
MSGLGANDLRKVRFDQIDVALVRLRESVAGAGLNQPDTQRLRDVGDGSRVRAPDICEQVRALHITLLRILTATDFRYGKAYGLGRALHDTCRVSAGEDLEAQLNPHRVANLRDWLIDLKTALPPHTGEAVDQSLQQWVTWLEGIDGDAKADLAHGEIKLVRDALRRQGRAWRACLSGEKHATDTLTPKDYIRAASDLYRNALELFASLPWRLKWGAPIAVVVTLILVGVASFTSSGVAVAGSLGALAGVLGISWAGARETIGAAASKLRHPLWGAALDGAAAAAITQLPDLQRARQPSGASSSARRSDSKPG